MMQLLVLSHGLIYRSTGMPMAPLQDLENRLKKTTKTLSSWATSHGYECYRVYDHDIPEFPYIIDRYGSRAVIWCQSTSRTTLPSADSLVASVANILGLAASACVYKTRQRQAGLAQYERLAESGAFFTVKEGDLCFRVNLDDYLDTGLFIDTRTIRQKLIPQARPGDRFLNLFAYTGSLSVAAAKKGYRTVTVDLSKTYLDWARENFRLNDLKPEDHEFIHADAREYVASGLGKAQPFALIYLDPPTFSNSKRMNGTFDVKRDHRRLVHDTMQHLADSGELLFVTNCQSFRLDTTISQSNQVIDLSDQTIPRDVARRRPHRSYRIRRKTCGN